MKDEELIEQLFTRDESALEEVSKKYGRYCRSIAKNILRNDEDAEECLNDTWLAAWDSIPPNRPTNLSAYLGRITRNLSLNRIRRDNTEKRGSGETALVLEELEGCIPAGNTVEEAMDEALLVSAIEDFLREQYPERRNIFVRRYWYLSPIKDIAKEYGMSRSKITSLLFRMRNELRAHLEKEGITI